MLSESSYLLRSKEKVNNTKTFLPKKIFFIVSKKKKREEKKFEYTIDKYKFIMVMSSTQLVSCSLFIERQELNAREIFTGARD